MRRLPATAAALAALLAAGPSRAAPRDGLAADLYARLNPLGLSLEAEGQRRWAVPDGEGITTRGRYLQAGALLAVCGAWVSLGPRAEAVPWAPLKLAAGYDALAVYGANGALLRLSGDDAPFGRGALDALRGAERGALVQRAFVQATGRLRLGPVVVQSANLLAAYRMAGAAGTYYEAEYDTLLRERDLLLQDRTTALWEAWRGTGEAVLLAGPAYELTRAVRTAVQRQRLGAVLYAVPWPERWALLRPRLLLFLGVNLEDRNRRGQPFAAAGLGFDLQR
jgi:hypothetical protein